MHLGRSSEQWSLKGLTHHDTLLAGVSAPFAEQVDYGEGAWRRIKLCTE